MVRSTLLTIKPIDYIFNPIKQTGLKMRNVYLDNNATTPMAKEVIELIKDNVELYGNASSMHRSGRDADTAVEWAREQVASLINCDKKGIVFTSGASEANNFVFLTFRDLIDEGYKRNRIITTTIEHPCIEETSQYLIKRGYKVDFLSVDRTGKISLKELEEKLGDDVALVSIMTGNNEVGTIEPIKEACALAHKAGALFHTDATQAIGKIDVDVKAWDVDYLSMSAHKFYGPKGVGALYARPGVPLRPLIHGGHQERGFRAGTYNTLAIAGMGEAARLAKLSWKEEAEYLWDLREMLRKGIEEKIPNVVINGHPTDCLPGTLDVSFPCAEGESILLYLDMEGIQVSTGSACATGSLEPSYVLLACGVDVEIAHGSIRFSLGRENTKEDIEYVLEKLPPIIKRVRMMSTRKEQSNG